jgi:hypothetical protein
MQTHNSRLYKLEGPNMHALYRIKYNTSNLGGINNYKPLKPVLETILAYPRIYGYS